MNWKQGLLVTLLAALLAACGSDGMKGTFEGGVMGEQTLVFNGRGKVVQQAGGVEQTLAYEVDGDKVRLTKPDQPNATVVLTRTDADTLSGGPMGMLTYKRKP